MVQGKVPAPPKVTGWLLVFNDDCNRTYIWRICIWITNTKNTMGKKISWFFIVNDARQYINDWIKNIPQTVNCRIPYAALSLEKLLSTTWGKLEFNKCLNNLMHRKFNVYRIPRLSTAFDHLKVIIKGFLDKAYHITPFQDIKTQCKFLGVAFSRDGNQEHQFQVILKHDY